MISELIDKKIKEAEKRIKELVDEEDLKKISEQDKYNFSKFYESKCLNRLKTAQLIFDNSKTKNDYSDYSEVVSATYYAMYTLFTLF